VVLLLAPVRLKEWAYAGFAITLGSALIAHLGAHEWCTAQRGVRTAGASASSGLGEGDVAVSRGSWRADRLATAEQTLADPTAQIGANRDLSTSIAFD